MLDRLRRDWEARRQRDHETAVAIGQRIVAHVITDLRADETISSEPRQRVSARGATEEQLAARRAKLAEDAEAARQRHARKRYRAASELAAAVLDQCAAEYGEIMGFPFRQEHRETFGRLAESSAPTNERARKAYAELRAAITAARELAYLLPNGCGGAAGRALVHMRGILPVLPGLNEPPFDKVARPGRSSFVREYDELTKNALGKELTDRQMAVLSLLWGNCPRGSYRTLLAAHSDGLTTNGTIDLEAKAVRRARTA